MYFCLWSDWLREDIHNGDYPYDFNAFGFFHQLLSKLAFWQTGPNNPSSKDWGVNFRALHDLFELAQYRNDLIRYEVGVQMIEIYNEQVRDLLCADGSNKKYPLILKFPCYLMEWVGSWL